MTAPVLVVLAVIASAYTRLTGAVGHTSFSVPVLLVVAAVVILALVVAVLAAARLLLRDGLRLRPVMS
jgi:hypothetical protein